MSELNMHHFSLYNDKQLVCIDIIQTMYRNTETNFVH